MIVIIRGHVRKSLSNDSLYRLVDEASKQMPIRLFIHTWSVTQTGVSWRTIHEDNTPVDEKRIRDYFGPLSGLIERVAVDEESSVEILGKKEGNVCRTPCPIKGYKYMFYGMMRAAEMVCESSKKDEMVFQTRFDIFSNWVSMSRDQIIEFMKVKPEPWEKIRFLIRPADSESELKFRLDRWMKWGTEYEPHFTSGIDNAYMAKAVDMRDFLRHMYYNLDLINERYREFIHQEWITMFEAFGEDWRLPSLSCV